MEQSHLEVETPHAAIMIWNYDDRLGIDDTDSSIVDKIETYRISASDCISIETSKTKGQPQGTFKLVLAPSTNFISAITSGSWCCIFMSTDRIDFDDLSKSTTTGQGKRKSLKMIGRIESIRLETQMGADGTRRSLYYVSGVDWGYVFNNQLYIDPAVAAVGDPGTQGNLLYQQLTKLFLNDKGPRRLGTNDLIYSLVQIFGFNTSRVNEELDKIGRLGKAVYEFKFPKELSTYLGLKSGQSVMSNLKIKFGALKAYNTYTPITEALSLPSVLSLQGQHGLWQVLLENSNPPLNEMFCDMDWEDNDDAPNLVLYKRIKPFSFKKYTGSSGKLSSKLIDDATDKLRSYFQYVKKHDIDKIRIISANIGTNWRDKFNYVQINFDTQQLPTLSNQIRKGLQSFDKVAFEREGFRPLIEFTRQFPITPKTELKISEIKFEPALAQSWVTLLREWYFDTHRMLNGTINIVGGSEYIAVGNNVKFELDVVAPTNNMTKKVLENDAKYYILGHIESVSHRFTVEPESGARTYTTTIQFSRGLIVDGDNVVQDQGIILDKKASDVPIDKDTNSKNTVLTSHELNPSPFKKKK